MIPHIAKNTGSLFDLKRQSYSLIDTNSPHITCSLSRFNFLGVTTGRKLAGIQKFSKNIINS